MPDSRKLKPAPVRPQIKTNLYKTLHLPHQTCASVWIIFLHFPFVVFFLFLFLSNQFITTSCSVKMSHELINLFPHFRLLLFKIKTKTKTIRKKRTSIHTKKI